MQHQNFPSKFQLCVTLFRGKIENDKIPFNASDAGLGIIVYHLQVDEMK